jgi:arylsulfatase A-like enzyme
MPEVTQTYHREHAKKRQPFKFLASADYTLNSFLTPSGQCTSTHLRIKDMAQRYAKLIVQVDAVIATIMQNLKQKMVLFKASCQNSLFQYTKREC